MSSETLCPGNSPPSPGLEPCAILISISFALTRYSAVTPNRAEAICLIALNVITISTARTSRWNALAGSGSYMTLRQVAREINRRLCGLFLPREDGSAPWQGDNRIYTEDPHWRGLKCFNEYFHADTGRGCGADHQTGWTALIARCMRDRVTGEFSEDSPSSTESR